MNTQIKSSLKETYLNGILLLEQWRELAFMRGDTQAQEIYGRMLDGAIERYLTKFPEDKDNQVLPQKSKAA